MQPHLTLTAHQMDQAAKVAKILHDDIRQRGGKNAHGLRDEDATTSMEAGGAQAELALSLYLRVDWTASNNRDAYGPDVGKRTQVRSSNRPRKHHCLIIRPRDLQKYGNVPFVLVIQVGQTFFFKGWMMAEEATRKGKLWNGGDPSRPPAWFVGEELLHPISTLKEV